MSPIHGFDRPGHRVSPKNQFVARKLMLALAGITVAASVPAFAQVYKWTDEDGVLHYSSAPPEKSRAGVQRIDSKSLEVSRGKTLPPDPNNPPAVQELASKVSSLERQLDRERQANQASMATQATYAQALANQQAARSVEYYPTIPVVSGVWLASPPYQNRYPNHCRAGMANCSQPGQWPRPGQLPSQQPGHWQSSGQHRSR
jgi:hypothetical protein